MEEFLAHSAQNGLPAQSYRDHICHVCEKAVRYAAEAEAYAPEFSGKLTLVAAHGAEFHDLGKLEPENQQVLRGKTRARHLPVNHVDAGTAYLLEHMDTPFSSVAVYSHHRGLPDFSEEMVREGRAFRDEVSAHREKTDRDLPDLLNIHRSILSRTQDTQPEQCPGDLGVFLRMALSCLADADHGDTAESMGFGALDETMPELRAEERLRSLDRYVEGLKNTGERSRLRSIMYENCRNASYHGGFASCDSPVGSGKTTAILAHLLAQAKALGLRRIFVVLPFTNIITQAAEVYRKALVLPGEDPEAVVAELHHRADFENLSLRHLTAQWRAPIIVTTAVAFFETLASNRPSTLRKLHELPGSGIFVDEAHGALPLHLLPVAWHWMKVLAEQWGCHWLLASGSLVRFWELPELIRDPVPVPELVSPEFRERLMQYEANRVRFCWKPVPMDRESLCRFVMEKPGPRLLIVNTVQSAAVLARDFAKACGRERVEHLSTALTPVDRSRTLARITQRLKGDGDWVLVATSCVEAGVDLSFRTGFREAASMISLLQTAGRINRSGSFSHAEVWTFEMQDDPLLRRNPAMAISAEVLTDYFAKNRTPAPEWSTKSVQDAIRRGTRLGENLEERENAQSFRTVAERFSVIESDTVPVLIDPTLASCLDKQNWRELQKHSVSISRRKLRQYALPELKPGLYLWNRPYSSFLGYMEGAL